MKYTQQLGIAVKAASLSQLTGLIKDLPRQHVDPSAAAGAAFKMPFVGGGDYLQNQTGQGEANGIAQSGIGGILGGLAGSGLAKGFSKIPGGKLKNIAAMLGGSYLGQAGGAYHAALDSNEAGNTEATNFLQELNKAKPTPLLSALAKKLSIKTPQPTPKIQKLPTRGAAVPSGFAAAGGGDSGGGGASGFW